MNNLTKTFSAVTLLAVLFVVSTGSVKAQVYDTGTTYPIYDTGTTYPTYDTGTTYPVYDTGTTYPVYDTGTAYPIYDTGTTYPTYDTGSVNYGYTNYGSTNYGYGNGYTYSNSTYGPGYTYPTTVYPSQPVLPVQPVYPVQPVLPVNPVVPVNPVTYCSDGSLPSPVTGCTHTTIVPVVNNTVCADGSYPINGSCTHTNVVPVINNTICSDGSYPVNGSCVHTTYAPTINYQTCWDGSTIPLYSVCPSQYKVCPNGTSIPVNQTCFYQPVSRPYVPPVTIKFNNAITSVPTEITLSSARCNGIGLIASNAPSTGWFEYGETANLGRETAKASIGSSPTAPFSNLLTNLKPTTTYYCRAVMQNQYGTVKGEVVAFTTKAKAVSYVKPYVKAPAKKSYTAAPKKNEIICIDGTIVSGGSSASTGMINNGQKLMSLQMEKVSGNLAPGGAVNYKLSFKNLSNDALTGVTLKVTIPAEITVTQASSGNYDPATHTLTAIIPSLPAQAEGALGLTGTVVSSAQVGMSVAMTGYAGYTVPGTNAQDEVTAYTVGSIVPATDGSADTGAKNVIGAASTAHGFLPSSLVEWLALIAIIFIIFILARSVYVSYKEEKVVH